MAFHESSISAPPYTPVQAGKTVILSISEGCIITADGREVRVLAQKWKVEMKDGRYAFRNLHSGMLLGLHFFGNVTAGVSEINEWELFVLDPVDGGYRFMVSNYWLWSNGFLLRPSLTNYLQSSSDEGHYTPISIQYIDS
ncbi:uncharacterized protein N7484_009151 [Penicillium longicatenatum]|uniref:uncharacterized protein n=1 Tax=Penicillium longicatenatum TaxID=1561947 RepID=UPI002547ED29|nr:uncharacterized protein N7484_009151 [Penicillium longicatenatum]KAJ5635838.1 hypothetical protein N7484_009151 [Penicillium longicatenatum]